MEIIKLFNIKIIVKGKPEFQDGPSILVGNHISYLDIPLLFFTCPDISFVSKVEIKRWPIIGRAASKASTIFVDRNDKLSRQLVKDQITDRLICDNARVVIFPSGTTSINETKKWKQGAFDIASTNTIPVYPFRIRYSPLRSAAYIDNDNFISHVINLFSFKRIEVELEFHPPVLISDSMNACQSWKSWCEHC